MSDSLTHKNFCIVLTLAIAQFALTACAASPATQRKKKIIEYGGWDTPSPAFMHQHLHAMEQMPFDGVVMRTPRPAPPGKRGPSNGWQVFGKKRFVPADYEHLLPDLRAIRSKKLTDNFIQVICKPADVDWDDDAGWKSICYNVGIMAMLAREGHCVGLMVDPEEYGKKPFWTFAGSSSAKRLTLEQAHKLAIQRGEQFMKAINAQFPNIQILFLFGPALTWDQTRGGEPGYVLLAPFIEGMCRAADAGTRITDGFEQSYGYRTRTSFRQGRKDILGARALFEDKKAFDEHMRVGFGIWIDNGSNKRPWQTKDFDLNYFQPKTWQNAIYYALRNSDHYIWVYSEQLNWWTGQKLPAAYVKAQEAGRTSPVDIPVRKTEYTPAEEKFVPHAGDRANDKCFANLLKTHEVLFNFPSAGWRFKPDPDNVGVKEHWASPTLDDSRWSPIQIRKFWEEQGWDYDGYGWYRINFKMPAVPANKQLLLAVGAADESARIWLNGVKICNHDIGEFGWDRLFTCDVTGKIRAGDNQLTIRVLDRVGAGGLYKSIKILSAK